MKNTEGSSPSPAKNPFIVPVGLVAGSFLDLATNNGRTLFVSHSEHVNDFLSQTHARLRPVEIETPDIQHGTNLPNWKPIGEFLNLDNQRTVGNERLLAPLKARVDLLGRHADGWKGTDSLGASKHAVSDAKALLERLVSSGLIAQPRIGLDEDGSFGFYWQTDQFVAAMSIFGDGTYSYFAREVGGRFASNDSGSLSRPVSAELLEILVA